MDEEDECESYEIDYRLGLELRYHKGEPGKWVWRQKAHRQEEDDLPGPHLYHEAQGQHTATVWVGHLQLGGGGGHRDCEGAAEGGRPILSSG